MTRKFPNRKECLKKKMKPRNAIRIFALALLLLTVGVPFASSPHNGAKQILQAPPHPGRTISPLVTADFSVSASPADVSVPQGSSTSSTVLVNSLNSFTGTISLAASGTPSGLSLSLSPTSGSLAAGCTCSSTLSISASTSTPAGLYSVTVTVTSGSLSHSTSLDVAVTPITGTVSNVRNFTGVTVQTTGSLSLDSPATSFAFSGQISVSAKNATTGTNMFSTTYTISHQPFTAYQGAYQAWIILNIPVSPYTLSSNLVVTFGTGGLAATSYSVTRNLDVNGDGNDDVSDYAIFQAAYGCKIGSPCYNPIADINADGVIDISDVAQWAYFYGAQNLGAANYAISANPTGLTINVGSSSISTITLSSQYAFAGTVNLSATVSPSGPSASPNPASITLASGGSGTSTLTVSTTSSTSTGSYSITVNATQGTRWHVAIVTVNVVDFVVSASPADFDVHNGSTGSSTITISPINGFTGTVSLTVTMTPSSGPTASLSPSTVTVSGCAGTSTLSIRANGTPGLYNFNVVATSGSLSHSLLVQVATGPLSWTINDNENFTGVNVKTTGTLNLDTPSNAITASGSITVVATNASTQASLFTKTYTITGLALNYPANGGYQAKFLVNVGVTPYPLATYLSINLSGPTSSAPGAPSVSTPSVERNADIDGNGTVDQADLNTMSAAYGCTIGQQCYNPRADLNADGIVNIVDLATAAIVFGATNYI